VNPTPGWFATRRRGEHASGGLTFAVPASRAVGTKEQSYGMRMPRPKQPQGVGAGVGVGDGFGVGFVVP
jgi:hypothetical protein